MCVPSISLACDTLVLIPVQAWAQCTVKDTTLVVFHCGTLERIGVRDRKNQALYLTDVIDIHACKDPAYGKLHVGLYMTALEDALDRVNQQLEAEARRAKLTADTKEQGPKRKRVIIGYTRRRGRGKKAQLAKVAKEDKNEDEDDSQARMLYSSLIIEISYTYVGGLFPDYH